MTNDRRSLVEGLKPAAEHQHAEEAFVYGERRPTARPQPIGQPEEPAPKILPQMYNRVPITTRARPELASALKRASLQRQLQGTAPFYVQDILEVAIETWLRDHGHLD